MDAVLGPAVPGPAVLGPDHGPADRAAAVVRALDRAEEAATGALRLLDGAGDVDWTGPGAAAYRDDLAAARAVVRRARDALRAAQAPAAEHAAAVRELEAQRAAAWLADIGGVLPGPRLPGVPGPVASRWSGR